MPPWVASPALVAVAGLLLAIPGRQERGGAEASGVARLGEELLYVDDSVPGVVFHVQIVEAWGRTVLGDTAVRRDEFAGARLASDLEALAVVDGDVLVLSEDLRRVLDRTGPRYIYLSRFGEFGNRGLEGFAVHMAREGILRAAALFEGGYPEPKKLPPEVRSRVTRTPLAPRLILHDLGPPGEVRRQSEDDSARIVRLRLEELEPGNGVPADERFRGCDLVWNRSPEGRDELIVLLSSMTPCDSKPRHHTCVWLQRFDVEGHVVGGPLDVRAWLRENRLGEIAGENWEGLGWWEPGRSLVLVNDAGGQGSTNFVFLPVPPAWVGSAD